MFDSFYLRDVPWFLAGWGLPFLLIFTCLLGLVVGSFLNVVAYRIPKILHRQWHRECEEFLAEKSGSDRTTAVAHDQAMPASLEAHPAPSSHAAHDGLGLAYPASHCPSCKTPIRWYDNIPLLSFLLLKGKCRACGAPISRRYPIVEGLCGLLTVLTVWYFGFTWTTLAAFAFVWCLLALALIDLDCQLLPEQLTSPLLWGGLLFNFLGGFAPLPAAVIGAMAGYLVLWVVYWGFKLVTGREGMGYGDFNLMAAFGAWFGWQPLPPMLLIAAVAGSMVGLALIYFRRHERRAPLPFGPFLALGGLAGLFWHNGLANFLR